MSKKVLMGNHAVSYGAMLSRVEVIAAYPITPQTQVVEELSELCASGKLKAKFIKVESEHSAMACCVGAASVGARTFTATSAQGLALMHEMLFWAAYGRLPIVMADVNRAMAPGWSIWTDQTDSLAQRDTGWIQLYCETNQEVLDTTIMAFKIAETVLLPVMIIYDAFLLSHTYEPVDIPEQALVDPFLPKKDPKYRLDINDPRAFSALTSPENYYEFRYIMELAHEQASQVILEVDAEFRERFNRGYGKIEEYQTQDADTLVVATGSMASPARVAIDTLRAKGSKVGMLKIKTFRPFPVKEIRQLLRGKKSLVVFDRNISHGMGGIFCQEIKAALFNIEQMPVVYGLIIGLGGRDVRPEDIQNAVTDVLDGKMDKEKYNWVGLKR